MCVNVPGEEVRCGYMSWLGVRCDSLLMNRGGCKRMVILGCGRVCGYQGVWFSSRQVANVGCCRMV